MKGVAQRILEFQEISEHYKEPAINLLTSDMTKNSIFPFLPVLYLLFLSLLCADFVRAAHQRCLGRQHWGNPKATARLGLGTDLTGTEHGRRPGGKRAEWCSLTWEGLQNDSVCDPRTKGLD